MSRSPIPSAVVLQQHHEQGGGIGVLLPWCRCSRPSQFASRMISTSSMRPGSSSVSGLTRLPCSCFRRVPSATVGGPGGGVQLVRNDDPEQRRPVCCRHRPRSGWSGSNIQKADVLHAVVRRRRRSSGSGHRGRPGAGLMPGRWLAGSMGLAWPVARRGLDTVAVARSGSRPPRRLHELPRNMLAGCAGLGIATRPSRRDSGTELVADRRNRRLPVLVDGVALTAFTSNNPAKSPSRTYSRTDSVAVSRPRLRTTMSSRMPFPTYR